MNRNGSYDYNETVKRYYTDLKECEPIQSRDKERELLKQAKGGDTKARNAILKSNLRCVFSIANKYRGCGVPMQYLISEGNMGLMYAIEKFDISNDVKFVTYATWWVKYYISDYIKRRGKVSANEVQSFVETDRGNLLIGIFDEEDDNTTEGGIVSDMEIDDEAVAKQKAQEKTIDKLLSELDKRERKIIEDYYGLYGKKEKNLDEISEEIGISKERVRQIKNACIIKMRSEVLLLDNFELNIF